MKTILLLATAASAGLVCGNPVMAQSVAAEAAGDAQSTEDSGIGDIVVTARRREESLQEVPVAVTALTAEDLSARSVDGINEFSNFTPNLRVAESQRGGSIATVSLRGQENPNQSISTDPAVGIYFDEVYLGRSAGALFATLQDMESVQVLRGNQGTLFGRNNTGGAVVLTPKRPDLTDIEGSADVTFGNYDRVELAGVLSVPLVDERLGVRVSGTRTLQDGIGRSITSGSRDFGNRDRWGGRAALRAVPVDGWTIDITFDKLHVRESGAVGVGLNNEVPAGSGYFVTSSAVPPQANVDNWGVTLRSEAVLSDAATFKVISGYRDLEFANRRDVDGRAAAAADVGLVGEQDQFSIEGQMSGDIALGNDGFLQGLTYVAGAFYFTEDGNDIQQRPYNAAPLFVAGSTLGAFGKNDSIAGYGQVEASLASGTSIWGGLRYTRDKRELTVVSRNAGACALIGNPVDCAFERSVKFGYWSWSAGVRQSFSSTVHAYLRAARGQRAGGLDDTPTDIVPFEPERLTDFELGIKADLFDRHLRTNLALFTGNYDGIQRSTLLVDSNNLPYTSIFNAATGRVRGIELEVTAEPLRGITLNGTLGYLDAKYKRFVDTRPGSAGADASGNTFPNAPKWSYSLSGQYVTGIGLGELALRADYSYKSRVEFDVYNNPVTHQDGFGLLNARATITAADEGAIRPHLSLFAKNLTNERYNSSAVSSAAGTVFFRTDQPRMYGIEIGATF